MVNNHCTCYPCTRFNQDTSFTYSNWKKSEKHKNIIKVKKSTWNGKWINYKASEKANTAVTQ